MANMRLADAAREWIARGFAVIPVPYREKKPVDENWPALRIGQDEVPSYFGERRKRHVGENEEEKAQ